MHFKELLTTEVQVKRVNKYGPEEISVGVITHPEDYTLEMERIFFDSKSSGKTYRMVLLEEVEDEPIEVSEENLPPEEEKNARDPLAVKRQHLALNIKEYAKQFKRTEQSIVEEIYARYKIKSRTELESVELDHEIKRYKPFTPEELREHG